MLALKLNFYLWVAISMLSLAQSKNAKKLKDALASVTELNLVILFGSLAKGNETSSSDVDVAIQGANPLTLEQRIQLTETLALVFNRPVDLIDLSSVGEPLLSEIVAKGVRVLGSDASWAQLIFRNIMENEDFVPLQRRIFRTRQQKWLNC